MDINELLKNRNITKYRLSKLSGVPHTTINDICSGKVKIENCAAGTLYKLVKVLDVTMEDLLAERMEYPGESTGEKIEGILWQAREKEKINKL